MRNNTNKWRTWLIVTVLLLIVLAKFAERAGAQTPPQPYVFYWGCDAIGVQLEPQLYDHLTAHISDGTRAYEAWLSRFDDGAYITWEGWLPDDTFRQYKLVSIETPDGEWDVVTDPITCGTPSSTLWFPILFR